MEQAKGNGADRADSEGDVHGVCDVFGDANPVGRVAIAGAGPGDPDLLTVQALRRIGTAQAIVYDALVSPEIRALFPPGARLYHVGKRAGRAGSTRQEDINRLLLRLAREGLEVLRLKGGDPFIFGRGGEELLYLQARDIPCEVLPGVSALNGAAAGAGIPLTHRGLSRNVTVLDGYGPHLDTIDWNALVALGGTWVFFMGRQSVREIAAQLLRHGAAPQLNLALVESATLPGQSVSVAPLAEAALGRGAVPGSGPGLLIVGPTVDLALHLSRTITEFPFDVTALSGLSQAGAQEGSGGGWR